MQAPGAGGGRGCQHPGGAGNAALPSSSPATGFSHGLVREDLIRERQKKAFLFSCVLTSIARELVKKHTKKPFSGLVAFNVLFFYIFYVVGFCYQSHLQFVANSVML